MTSLIDNPISTVISTVGKLAEDLVTTDKDRMAYDKDMYVAETERMSAQTDINKAEATSESLFVSGARPFVMWVCGFAFAYATIFEPMGRFIAAVCFGYSGVFPEIDTNLTMQVLFGVLGLGVMRSWDKKSLAK